MAVWGAGAVASAESQKHTEQVWKSACQLGLSVNIKTIVPVVGWQWRQVQTLMDKHSLTQSPQRVPLHASSAVMKKFRNHSRPH